MFWDSLYDWHSKGIAELKMIGMRQFNLCLIWNLTSRSKPTNTIMLTINSVVWILRIQYFVNVVSEISKLFNQILEPSVWNEFSFFHFTDSRCCGGSGRRSIQPFLGLNLPSKFKIREIRKSDKFTIVGSSSSVMWAWISSLWGRSSFFKVQLIHF